MKEHILTHLANHPWRDRVHWYDCVESTNTLLKQMAAKGAPHGTVVLADRQTGGRGRMGRSFCSPAGTGIYLSVLLRPDCSAQALMHLTCAVAVAMCDAVETASGFRPDIKWINDLQAKGKKLGGILTELSIDPASGRAEYAVVGVGINCTLPPDFPGELREIATALDQVAARPTDRYLLAAKMIGALGDLDARLLTEQAAIMDAYRKNCVTLGHDIFLLRGDTQLPCHALTVENDGALLVRCPDGKTEAVSSGEVSVRPA